MCRPTMTGAKCACGTSPKAIGAGGSTRPRASSIRSRSRTCRHSLDNAGALRLPLSRRLAPQVDRIVLEGRGHLAGTAIGRAQALRQLLRVHIVRMDRMDDVGPAERIDCEIHGGDRGLEGVALAPHLADDAP